MKLLSCLLVLHTIVLKFCFSAGTEESAFFMTPSLREVWDDPTARPSPFIESKSERTAYTPTDWSLYEYDQPQARDLKQGNIGNCFLAQTLKAIAYAQPNLLKRNIPVWDKKDGQFVVVLFNLRGQPIDIAVDLVMDVQNSSMGKTFDPSSDDRFSIPRTSAETRKTIMWPIVFEKAVVKALYSPKADELFGILRPTKDSKTGYHALDAGGYADRVMTMLTGMPYEYFKISTKEENYGKFVAFLKDHEGLPLVLSSKEDKNIEINECTRPEHVHPLGKIDIMNLQVEILCDNFAAEGKFFSFAKIYEMMTFVISIQVEHKFRKSLLEIPADVSQKRNPWHLFETTELVIPGDRYDGASTVLEFCKSQSLECGQMTKSTALNAYEVKLQSPHSLRYKKSHWDENFANFVVNVDDSIPEIVERPAVNRRFFAHSATTDTTGLYSIKFAVLYNAIQKLGSLMIPDFTALSEKEKFLHYVQMLDTATTQKNQGVRRSMQTVMILKQTYWYMPCSWPVGAFLIPIEDEGETTAFRCGGRTVNVKNSNIEKYFERFQVPVNRV